MKSTTPMIIRGLFLTAAACLIGAGCSSPNKNPPVPRAHTGYVDFYTDSTGELSWRVRRANESTGEMRTVFSDFKPIRGNTLRLAATPGTYRFEIWFSNQVTTGPKTVVVQVANAKITPVHVTITPAGSVSVVSQSYEYRPTGRTTRRVTRLSTDQQPIFEISATVGSAEAYQAKEWMPYWSSTAK